jgi:hypothetical protein
MNYSIKALICRIRGHRFEWIEWPRYRVRTQEHGQVVYRWRTIMHPKEWQPRRCQRCGKVVISDRGGDAGLGKLLSRREKKYDQDRIHRKAFRCFD